MKYTQLGGTGLIVSRLALGTMTFGEGAEGPAGLFKVDAPGAGRLVTLALDAGINYFNTADVYAVGRGEEMLGAALKGRRADVVIATKVGHRMGPALINQGLSRRQIVLAAEASLKRLCTDWIDVYLVHRLDPYTPVEETLEALQELVTAGKVRYVGVSNWPAWLAAKAVGIQRANHWQQFRAAEMYYSLVGRDLEHEFVPMALDAGIGVQVWSPLAGGFLTGRYSRSDPSGGGGRLVDFDLMEFDREHGYQIIDQLRSVAAAHAVTPARVALAWLLSRPAVTSILVGASTTEQLSENLLAVDLELTAEDIACLGEVSAKPLPYPSWFNAKIFDQPMKNAGL